MISGISNDKIETCKLEMRMMVYLLLLCFVVQSFIGKKDESYLLFKTADV